MTREESLLNAYLKGVKNEQSKTVSAGTRAVSSAASEGVKMMNQAANVHIPSMYDYSKDMYKLIQEQQEEQIKSQRAAQRAAASAAKKQQKEAEEKKKAQQKAQQAAQAESQQKSQQTAQEKTTTAKNSGTRYSGISVSKKKSPEELQSEARQNYSNTTQRMSEISSRITSLDDEWEKLMDERDKLSQSMNWVEEDRAGMSSPKYRQYQEMTASIEAAEKEKESLEAELEKISDSLRPIVKQLPDDERAAAYAESWYVLSDEEKKDAKQLAKNYTSREYVQSIYDPITKTNRPKELQMNQIGNKLDFKTSLMGGFWSGLFSSIPFYDDLTEKYASETYDMLQSAKTQNPKSALAGNVTGALGGYALGSAAVKAIPGVGAAATKAGQALGATKGAAQLQKIPVLGRAFTGDALTGIISDQIADTVLDTIPETVQNVREGKPVSSVVWNTGVNFGTNALMNIGAEGVLGTVGDALKRRQNQRIQVVENPKSIEYNTPIPQLRQEVQADAEMGRPVQSSAETGAAVIPDGRSASRAVSLSPDEQISAEWGSDAPWPTDADRPPEQIIPNYGDPFEMTNAEKAAEVTGKGLQSVYTREIAALYDDADKGADITERAAKIAERMVKESDFKVQGDTSYNNARKEFVKSPMRISDSELADLLYSSGEKSISSFNKKYRTRITKTDQAAPYIDTVDFSAYGYSSDPVTNFLDMLNDVKSFSNSVVDTRAYQESLQDMQDMIVSVYKMSRETNLVLPEEIPYVRRNIPAMSDGSIPYLRNDLPESIGAMRSRFDRPIVKSQQNTLRGIDEQYLSPADMEIQGGPVSYTHERVSFAEQRKNAENILSTESIDEVLNRLDDKDAWNSEDMATALEGVRRIDDALRNMDKTTDEYRSLFYANQQAKQKIQDSLGETGRTLGVTRMMKPAEEVVMEAQKRVKKAIERLEKRQPKPFGDDVFKTKQAVKRAEDEAGKAVDDVLSTVNMTARELGIDFRRLARQTGAEKQAALQKIQQAIQKARGMTDEQAIQLVEQIQQAYKQTLEKAVDQNLRQMLPELFGKKARKAVPQAYDKFISLLNMGRYNDDAVKELVASKWGIAPLTPEQTEQVTELMEQASQFPEKSRQRADLQAQAAGIVASNINSSLMEKWDAWRYTAMLGNVRTNERNIIPNVSQAMLARAKEVVQASAEVGVDWIAKNVLGTDGIQRTTAIINPSSAGDRALMAGAFKDADNAVYTDLIGGSEMFDITREMQKQGKIFNSDFLKNRQTVVGDVLGKGMDTLESLRTGTSRALEGADYEGAWGVLNAFADAEGNALQRAAASKLEKVAKRGEEGWFGISGVRNNYAWSLSEYLKANGADARIFQATDQASKELLDKARAWATQQAMMNTYHEVSKVAEEINGFARRLEKDGGTAGKLISTMIKGLFPFTKTPINILKSAYRYSPLGFASALGKLFGTKSGIFTAADVIDSASKSVVGTGLFLLGGLLQKNGMLVGSMTDDERKAAEVTGQQEYSINFTGPDGKKYSYTIDWLSAFSLPMLMGAEFVKQKDQMGESGLNAMVNASAAMLDPLVSMTFLESLDNVFQTVSNVKLSNKNDLALTIASAAALPLISYVTQGIPSVFGQVARSIDPLRRSTYTGKTGIENVVAKELLKAKNRIPFLSKTSEPYIDPLGQVQENPGGNFLGRLAYQMLSPGFISEVKDVDIPVYPERPEYTVEYKDSEGNPVRHRWTPEEYTQISRIQGQKSKDWIESLYDYPLTSALNQDQITELYESGYSKAKDKAKRSVVPEIQQEYENEIFSGKPDQDSRMKWIYDNLGESTLVEALTAKKLIDKVGTTKSGNKVVKTKKENSIELLMQYGYTREHAEYLYSLLTESNSLF